MVHPKEQTYRAVRARTDFWGLSAAVVTRVPGYADDLRRNQHKRVRNTDLSQMTLTLLTWVVLIFAVLKRKV